MKTLALCVAVLAAILAPRTRAEEPKAAPAAGTAGAAPVLVDGPTARRLVAAGVKVVDVRSPAEFGEGHVSGAVNIPYDEMGRRFAEIGPVTTPVLLYCRTGRRSGIAGRTLREKGFTQLYDMKSYDAWTKSERALGSPALPPAN